MSLLALLPLAMGLFLAVEILVFGLLVPRLRRAFLLSATSGLGMVAAWGASLQGQLGVAVACTLLAGLAHGVDLWRRGRG